MKNKWVNVSAANFSVYIEYNFQKMKHVITAVI